MTNQNQAALYGISRFVEECNVTIDQWINGASQGNIYNFFN